MQGVKALLFDKDGTLVHFDRTWGPAAGAVMRHLAAGDTAALHRLEQVSDYLPAQERFLPSSPLVAGSSAHYGSLWAVALGREATPDFFAEIDRLFSQEGLLSLTPIGNPHAVLACLRDAGFRLAIVTNDAEANARLQVEALGLLPFLDDVVGYDSGYGSKPAPGMVRVLAPRYGVLPHEMAVIGDSAHDMAAAHGAGARFILVRSGPADVGPLLADADLVLDSIDDLPDLFAEMPAC